jgi:flavin-dependent thymidylate synthase
MNNTVELIGHYGSDEVIACSAWTSTSRNLTGEKRERVEGLIDMLWSNGHETPFEKGIVHFLVNTDIATHIHLLKHRISNINAESARYKELKEDKYYTPDDWPLEWVEKLEDYTNKGFALYHECISSLTNVYGIDRKRAKETARFFRGYNTQIEADIMFNMRSFANFLKLRDSEHAQKEVRNIAQQMVESVKSIEGEPFKFTLKAFGY